MPAYDFCLHEPFCFLITLEFTAAQNPGYDPVHTFAGEPGRRLFGGEFLPILFPPGNKR